MRISARRFPFASAERRSDKAAMRSLLFLPAALLLSGCIVGTVARTAVDLATLPVKAASAGVDAVTTSQGEADQNLGRKIRREEEARGREARAMARRCANGQPLATDVCPANPR